MIWIWFATVEITTIRHIFKVQDEPRKRKFLTKNIANLYDLCWNGKD